MTLTNSVDTPGSFRRALGGDTYAWDWSATTHLGAAGVVDDLLEALGARVVLNGKGSQGWAQSVEAYDAGGYKTGAVFFGGGRDDVQVVSSSSQADEARRAVVSIGEARTSRVDTKIDTKVPFDELRAMCLGLGGRGTQVLDYSKSVLDGQGGVDAGGRTIYVGAPSSAVRVRVYEKWLESPGMYEDGVNRVEVQLRPPSRTKGEVSRWGPAETFCASKLTRRLADALELETAHPPSLQKSKGTPDLQRTLEAMGEQYGKAARKWLDLSGGDVGTVLDYLTDDSGNG